MESNYPSAVWKHCPYCGSQQIEWSEGTHRMRCNTCGGVFFINMSAAVVALIRNEKGELLFTKRKNDPAKGKLDLPGGFVNLGETAEDAVRREIKEELNIVVENLNYTGSYPNRYLYKNIVYFTLDMVFECVVSDFSTLQVNDDVSGYIFAKPGNVNVEDIGLDSIRLIVSGLIDNYL